MSINQKTVKKDAAFASGIGKLITSVPIFLIILSQTTFAATWWDLRFTDGNKSTYDTAIENAIESMVLSASSRVYVANYSVPSVDTKLTTSMNDRYTAGCDVRYAGELSYGNYTGLNAGIPYILDSSDGSPYMHDKFIIIDPNYSNRIMLTGSGNFTSGGWGTQDDPFIITRDENIIKQYLNEYYELFSGNFHSAGNTTDRKSVV